MHNRIAFILLFCLRTNSLAADVSVYNKYDYFHEELQNLEPVAVSRFPFKFGYYGSDYFLMILCIRNKSPSVTAINVTSELDDGTIEVKKPLFEYGRRRRCEEYYHFYSHTFFRSSDIKVRLEINTSNLLCSSLLVAKWRAVTSLTNATVKKEYPDYSTSLKSGCVLVVDLKNKCDGPPLATKTTTTPEYDGTDGETINPNNTFTSNSSTNLEITTHKNSANDTKNRDQQTSQYVIPSVMGMCVIILMIYLLWVKKCCHRNSPTVTLELNTCHHEPFYLNMLFRRECDQEIAEIDQHVYEEIAPHVTEGG